ncbi:MAG: hypothetical protein HUU16_22380 [Candidatus Omnitrophica bacterium]|nr:hypothetical protein [bacterium]NUN98909.1 hypothetical protein [Candidatus Omnitrophota bacterium]
MAKRKGPEGVIHKLEIDFIKSHHYRVVQVDGAWGSVGPHGNTIQMSVYNERFAIPQQVSLQVDDGVAVKELDRSGKKGLVREIECTLVMGVDQAEAVAKWLMERAEEARRFNEKRSSKEHRDQR